MCGICGMVASDPGRPAPLDAVRRMTAALAHRGPDGEGVTALGPAALGSRRLAIVDRTPAGAQPLGLPDSPHWIVHNGEIYGHAALRRELAARGHGFRSRSDTEVVLRLYRERGAAALERLDGMFAFAIWDGGRRELFAARDRFGKKPLYYRRDRRGLAFASEIKALLDLEAAAPEVEVEALHHFLSFDYVPGPGTAFRGILQLPPGHWLRYRDGELAIGRWFELERGPRLPAPPPAEAEREIRARLRGAVDRRRPSEVPFGVFLSGGVDSAAVVATLAELGVSPLRTFSVALPGTRHDESRWATLVARRFGTEHHELALGADLASELPRVVRQFDQPFGDPSALPTYLLAREARREITVALTGEGGDEAFAGYDRYRHNALAARYLGLPRPLRRALAAALAPLARAPVAFSHPLRRLARFAALEPVPPERLYCRWLLHFDADEKRELYTPELRAAVREESCARLEAALAATGGEDLLARELGADLAGYLPDDLLVKTDVATMAHGLEARCPFLDLDLAGYAAGLPSSHKLRGGTTKWILKRALRGRLPSALLHRPKGGFGLPLDAWLRGPLRAMARDLLLDRRAADRGLFRPEAVRRLLEEHERGTRSRSFEIWNLMVLEIWYRERVDAAAGAGAAAALGA